MIMSYFNYYKKLGVIYFSFKVKTKDFFGLAEVA